MKWCFVALLLLNVLVAAMQWISLRAKTLPEVYSVGPGAMLIELREEREVKEGRLAAQDVEQCLLLGPLASQDAATYWQKQFQWANVAAEVVVQEAQKAPGFMVYLEPGQSQAAALALLRELQVQNIESFVISSGEYQHGVSLGIYENLDLASVRKVEISQRGFAAKVTEIRRSSEMFWVFLKEPYLLESKKKIDNILAVNSRLPEMRQIFCKSVASKKLLP